MIYDVKYYPNKRTQLVETTLYEKPICNGYSGKRTKINEAELTDEEFLEREKQKEYRKKFYRKNQASELKRWTSNHIGLNSSTKMITLSYDPKKYDRTLSDENLDAMFYDFKRFIQNLNFALYGTKKQNLTYWGVYQIQDGKRNKMRNIEKEATNQLHIHILLFGHKKKIDYNIINKCWSDTNGVQLGSTDIRGMKTIKKDMDKLNDKKYNYIDTVNQITNYLVSYLWDSTDAFANESVLFGRNKILKSKNIKFDEPVLLNFSDWKNGHKKEEFIRLHKIATNQNHIKYEKFNGGNNEKSKVIRAFIPYSEFFNT